MRITGKSRGEQRTMQGLVKNKQNPKRIEGFLITLYGTERCGLSLVKKSYPVMPSHYLQLLVMLAKEPGPIEVCNFFELQALCVTPRGLHYQSGWAQGLFFGNFLRTRGGGGVFQDFEV